MMDGAMIDEVPIVGGVDVPMVGNVGVPIVAGVGVPMVGGSDVPMVGRKDVPIDGRVGVPIVDKPRIVDGVSGALPGRRKPSTENASSDGKVDALTPAADAPIPALGESGEIPGVVERLSRGDVEALVPVARVPGTSAVRGAGVGWSIDPMRMPVSGAAD